MICNIFDNCVNIQVSADKVSKCANGDSSQCIMSADKRSKVQCAEKQKKYVLENTQGNLVLSYKMDGGIIVQDKTVPPGTCKCDYLFLSSGKEKTAILIELKGKNVAHALKQIREVLEMEMFKNLFGSCQHVYGRIVATSFTPKLKATPDYVKLDNRLRSAFGGNIDIKEKQFTEKDIEMDSK